MEFDQVLEIVAKSHFLAEVIGKSALKRLLQEMPDLDNTPVRDVVEKIGNLEDQIFNIKSNKFMSFRIVSDDRGGSEAGPWQVNVFGACGVWLVSTIEYDDLWFSDRAIAISAAYKYAHEIIIEEIDRGVFEFQQANSEMGRDWKLGNIHPSQVLSKSQPENRVLGFYLADGSSHIYFHSNFGQDCASDILGLISRAFKASEREVCSALAKAQELRWQEAIQALQVVLDEKMHVSRLELEIKELNSSRTIEIKVDDWCRGNNISEPKIEDFVRMAASLKPFFHHREASKSWDLTMPKSYLDAYVRLVRERKKFVSERAGADEE